MVADEDDGCESHVPVNRPVTFDKSLDERDSSVKILEEFELVEFCAHLTEIECWYCEAAELPVANVEF